MNKLRTAANTHFHSQFPYMLGKPIPQFETMLGIAAARDDGVVTELQSNHHHQHTNTQVFYRLDALPNQPCQSTEDVTE